MNRHDAMHARLTDYALDELDETQRRDVEDHLASCAECSAEVRALRETLGGLALSLGPVRPPVQLRERVLADFARLHSGTNAAVVTHRLSSWNAARPWLAAAALLVIAMGGLLAVSANRADRMARELERSRQEIATLRERIDTVGFQADLAVAILTAPDMRRIDLAGLDRSRDTRARAYWSAGRGLLIVADELPSPPPGRDYQVWLIAGSGGPVSAGLLGEQGAGRGMLIAPARTDVQDEAVTIAVTDEPAGGRQAPSGAKHLVGSA